MNNTKIKLISISLLIMLFLFGCDYKKEEVASNLVNNNDELESKYDKMKSKYEILLGEINGLNKQYQDLQSDVDTKSSTIQKLEEELKNIKSELGHHKEIIKELKKEFDNNNIDLANNNDAFTVYDPKNIKVGDKFGGLTVSGIEVIENGEFVSFDGHILVKCDLMINEADGGIFGIYIDKSDVREKLPVSTSHIDYFRNSWDGGYYCLSNDDEMIKKLGDEKYQEMSTNRVQYRITALLDQYNHVFVEATGVRSRFRLVELLDIQELKKE